MDFINEQIDTGSIPDATSINWQPMEKDYLKVLRLEWLFTSVVLLLVAIALLFFVIPFRETLAVVLFISGWLLIVSLYFFIQERSFHLRAYAIREHDILYRYGWIVQHIHACPVNRIQHCSSDAGPLERKFKLSSLTLFTAGTSGADLRISGLRAEIAENIRDFIMNKIKTDEQTGN
ncbi:MAG TPA: PH domain-containing protein [Chitinophagaceae bacterium]